MPITTGNFPKGIRSGKGVRKAKTYVVGGKKTTLPEVKPIGRITERGAARQIERKIAAKGGTPSKAKIAELTKHRGRTKVVAPTVPKPAPKTKKGIKSVSGGKRPGITGVGGVAAAKKSRKRVLRDIMKGM